MLTPNFSISQNDTNIFVTIHAPFTSLKDVEINVLGSDFWFHTSPYFLRLKFPCCVLNDDEPPTSYDSDNGEFKIQLQKQEVGQHFPDLDLLGLLLTPKKNQKLTKPSIEELSDDVEGAAGEEEEEESSDEWLVEQELPSSECKDMFFCPKYGFGNLASGVFQHVKTEFKEIVDLPDPDMTQTSLRDELRIAEEDKKFCSDHYIADFMELEVLEESMVYRPPWLCLTPAEVKLTGEEKDYLKKIGNKEYLLSKHDKRCAWWSLVDIVFAYAYDHRTTQGESTVESAWTINKLSATLSWFTNHTSLQSVVITSFRRLLTFGLYRNWDLAQLVLQDTLAILKLGRREVLKCLIEVHTLFMESEPRYLLNQLYISDYCIWLQRVSERKLTKLTEALQQIHVSKADMGFDLDELEQAALLVEQEENEEVLSKEISNLKLETSKNRLSSSSSSSTSESSGSLDSDDDSSPES